MRGNDNKRKRAGWGVGFAAFCALTALSASARPTEAGPFAYVATNEAGIVSVIDTANNQVVATVQLAGCPTAIAVTPDGKALRQRLRQRCLGDRRRH